MNSQTTISATKARSKFFNILDKVEKTNLAYTITVNGSARAVIMNALEYYSWMETLDILSNPELVKGIEKGKKDIADGRVISLDDYLKKENLFIEGNKVKQNVRSKTIKKSREKSQ